MNFLPIYQSQYQLRGESITCYGSDFRGCVTYNFNDQGFRNDFNFDFEDPDPLVICLGSSIATGHGLELSQTFGHLVARHFDKKYWNLGQGCFRSSNQTMLEQIEFLSASQLYVSYYIIQFTHINRMGNKESSYVELDQEKCMKNFVNILEQTTHLLQGKKWCWMLCDWSGAKFPDQVINHPNKIAIDPDSVDFVDVENYRDLAPTQHALKMLSLHPGSGWNQHMANLIIRYFDEHQ